MAIDNFWLWDNQGNDYDIDVDMPDGFSWYPYQSVTNRFQISAVEFSGYSTDSGASAKALRLIDLPSGRVLASASLSSGQFLVNSIDADTRFQVGELSNGKLVLKSYDYALTTTALNLDSPVGTTVTISMPAGTTWDEYVSFEYAGSLGSGGYLIVNDWDLASMGELSLYSLTAGASAQASLIALPSETYDWVGNVFVSGGQLWIETYSALDEFSGSQSFYRLNGSTWTPVDEFDFWDARDAALGDGGVIRAGESAIDLLNLNWVGTPPDAFYVDDGNSAQLPDGSLLVRVETSFSAEALDIGYERWLIIKDGQIVADKAFNAALGLRSVKTLDEGHVYFQQVDASFTGSAGNVTALKQNPGGVTLYKIALDQVASVLANASDASPLTTLAGAPGVTQVARYTQAQLPGNAGADGQIEIVQGYIPASLLVAGDPGALVWSGFYDPTTDQGAQYFSRIEADGTVTLSTELPGDITDVLFEGGLYAIAVDGDDGEPLYYALDPATGALTSIDSVQQASDVGDVLSGDSWRDMLFGGAGDDTLVGESGDDTLVGGEGNDAAVFLGNMAAYEIIDQGDGSWVVKDNDAVDGDEGTDTLIGIEELRFADQTSVLPQYVPVNQPPEISPTATVSVVENAAVTQVVYTAQAVADSELRYSLSGADADAFTIDAGTGVVKLKAAADYETKTRYEVNVTATDDGGLSATQALTVNVSNVVEPTVITSASTASVAENTDVAAVVYTAVATADAGRTLTYSLTGADAAAFNIDGNTGVVTLKKAADYETKKSYSVNLVATDSAKLSVTKPLVISVTDVNDAPVFSAAAATATVVENAGVIKPVHVAKATDADANSQLVYSLSGADADAFTIDGKTGMVKLKAAANYEAKSSYTVNLVATDNGSPAQSATQSLKVNVTDVNEAPVFSQAAATVSVAENSAVSTVVHLAGAVDADAKTVLKYSLAGKDAKAFTIDASGAVKLVASANYEAKSSYSVNLVASDGKLNATQALKVNVTDVNEAPVVKAIKAAATATEGKAFSHTLPAGTFSDPEKTALSYSATQADGSALPAWLKVNASTGALSGTPDYAAADAATLTLKLIATDKSGATSSTNLTLKLSNTVTIAGTVKADVIVAGAGSDKVTGGKGADVLTGGAGKDSFVFAAGDSGQASGFDQILDYAKGVVGLGDLIDYKTNLVKGGVATAAADKAAINVTTAVATFDDGSGMTLADALADVANSLKLDGVGGKAKDTAGEFAFFQVDNAGDHYLFISDGKAGVTANDVVVQLVGVSSIGGIDLTGGNLTITS